jgi:hypothetical protein
MFNRKFFSFNSIYFRNIQSLLKLNMIMKIRKNQKVKENLFQHYHVGQMMYRIRYNVVPVKQIVSLHFTDQQTRYNHF